MDWIGWMVYTESMHGQLVHHFPVGAFEEQFSEQRSLYQSHPDKHLSCPAAQLSKPSEGWETFGEKRCPNHKFFLFLNLWPILWLFQSLSSKVYLYDVTNVYYRAGRDRNFKEDMMRGIWAIRQSCCLVLKWRPLRRKWDVQILHWPDMGPGALA